MEVWPEPLRRQRHRGRGDGSAWSGQVRGLQAVRRDRAAVCGSRGWLYADPEAGAAQVGLHRDGFSRAGLRVSGPGVGGAGAAVIACPPTCSLAALGSFRSPASRLARTRSAARDAGGPGRDGAGGRGREGSQLRSCSSSTSGGTSARSLADSSIKTAECPMNLAAGTSLRRPFASHPGPRPCRAERWSRRPIPLRRPRRP